MNQTTPDFAEQAFFQPLIQADPNALADVLADDFILIDVMTGSEVSKEDLVAIVSSGLLRFISIDRIEYRIRFYGGAAVITGRTEMKGQHAEQEFGASSRYTHIFVEMEKKWCLASAQGTQIVSMPVEA